MAGVPATALTWAELAKAAAAADLPDDVIDHDDGTVGLAAQLDFDQGEASFPFGTHIAVVEVDTETGDVELLRHIAVDDAGTVGKAYGAERTPHLFVVDTNGVLAYKGAIDNSPDGEQKSPEGGKLVNYVESALTALGAGAKVDPAETKAYGCTVKY